MTYGKLHGMTGRADSLNLVPLADARLRNGEPPADVFGDLSAETAADLHVVALAVCIAAGVNADEAERRLVEHHDVLTLIEPGEERDLGWLLEHAGFFDRVAELDDTGHQVKQRLEAACKAIGRIPSGWAANFFRHLTAGNLIGAFISLVRVGTRLEPEEPRDFWTNLKEAADLLGNRTDDRFAEAARECRFRAVAS